MRASDKPLAGKRIVITRAPAQSVELAAALEKLGARVISLPLVAFAPPKDKRPLDSALRSLARFDAILFLSRNAVRYVCERCGELGIKGDILASPNRLIAAVGPATAEEAARKGWRVSFVAENRTGESLAHELGGHLAGRNVLLPRSDRGDERVPSALRDAGANVTEVVAYRTIAPEALDPEIIGSVRRGDVDAIVFASPSACHNFRASVGAEALKQISERVHFAAIGPSTARAIRESGARVDIEVNEAALIGIDAIAEALARFFHTGAPAAPARSA